jgi:hypothetical protein
VKLAHRAIDRTTGVIDDRLAVNQVLFVQMDEPLAFECSIRYAVHTSRLPCAMFSSPVTADTAAGLAAL